MFQGGKENLKVKQANFLMWGEALRVKLITVYSKVSSMQSELLSVVNWKLREQYVDSYESVYDRVMMDVESFHTPKKSNSLLIPADRVSQVYQ